MYVQCVQHSTSSNTSVRWVVGCGLWDVWWSIIMGYMDFGFWSGDAPHNLERTKRENLKTPHQDGS